MFAAHCYWSILRAVHMVPCEGRLIQLWMYCRNGDPDDNHYAHPLDFIPVVDLNLEKVWLCTGTLICSQLLYCAIFVPAGSAMTKHSSQPVQDAIFECPMHQTSQQALEPHAKSMSATNTMTSRRGSTIMVKTGPAASLIRFSEWCCCSSSCTLSSDFLYHLREEHDWNVFLVRFMFDSCRLGKCSKACVSGQVLKSSCNVTEGICRPDLCSIGCQ